MCGHLPGIGLDHSRHEAFAKARRVEYSKRHGGRQDRSCSRRSHRAGDPGLHRHRSGRRSQRNTTRIEQSAYFLVICAQRREKTYSRLVGKAITRWHGQMSRGSVRVVLELVMIQGTAWRGSAIAVAGEMRRVHQGRAILVAKGVWFGHVSSLVQVASRAQSIELQDLGCTSRTATMCTINAQQCGLEAVCNVRNKIQKRRGNSPTRL